MNGHSHLPNELEVSTELVMNGNGHYEVSSLDRSQALDRFSSFIDQLACVVEDSFFQDREPPVLIFPLKGSLVIYYSLMHELISRGKIDLTKVHFMFSIKDAERGTDQQAYLESRTNGETYRLSTADFQYREGQSVFVVEDVLETGVSAEATHRAFLERFPEHARKSVLIPASIKHMSQAFGEEGVQLREFAGGTMHLDDSWKMGYGMDGGLTGHLVEYSDVVFNIEVLERMCILPISKPDPKSRTLQTAQEIAAYINFLSANSILGELTPEELYTSDLYGLLDEITRVKGMDAKLDFMTRYHSNQLRQLTPVEA